MDKSTLKKILPKCGLIVVGYIVANFKWSFILLLISLATLAWIEFFKTKKINKIKIKTEACTITKHELVQKINEIPSWVKFPDKERAEWLNEVIAQLWPALSKYITKLFRGSIQTKIRKKYDSFRFEDMDFGCNPPKIDGIKVYNCTKTKDQIIIDFDIFYDGNCDIHFSLSGAQIGGIQDFQLSAEARVVLKPLLHKLPLIGGIQVYFLNAPEINFSLDGLPGIPGLSSFISSKIEERFRKLIVFPNKFTKRFSKSVEASELRALEPCGVLRVHVSEAKDLMAKDLTGKSDPYVIVNIGAQEFRTHYVSQSLNPKWDCWFEFIIGDSMAQHLSFKLYDHDNVNEDDFLGRGDLDIATILKGDTDQWVKLDEAKHGMLHLRFTWLSLSPDVDALDAAVEEAQLLKVTEISTALLVVYIESAENLPTVKPFVKPHPFVVLVVGNKKDKTKAKKHTVDPQWDQGFVFLVHNPKNDTIFLNILDKQTGETLTRFSYKIQSLLTEDNLEISKQKFLLDDGDGKIVLSLQLRVLANELFEFEDDDSDSDCEINLSRQILVSEKVSSTSFMPTSTKPFVKKTSSLGEHGLGRIEITLSYSEPRQKFLVTIHRLQLPMKDPADIPDPYVKVALKSRTSGHSLKNKTKHRNDTYDPVYEETFDYLLAKSEVYDHSLAVTVKSVKFFGNETIGQLELNLRYVDLSETDRKWYELTGKGIS